MKLKTIANRLRRRRNSHEFAFRRRVEAEQTTLRKHYGSAGGEAADLLDDIDEMGALVDDAALAHLVQLGWYWKPEPSTPPANAFVAKLHDARKPWWNLAYDLDCKRHDEPDLREVGSHPRYTPDPLVNRFIGECSIQLAQHHHDVLYDQRRGPELRGEEHDTLLAELDERSPKFAHIGAAQKHDDAIRIAKAYRTHEPIRADFAHEPLVQLGEKAFGEDLTGKKLEEGMKGKSGKEYETEDVQGYIRTVDKLPTFGEWDKAKGPARVIAMARGIQASGVQGIAFTANLTMTSFGMAADATRETGSAIQDRLRKHLKREFGTTPELYFVMEHGIGQRPHIHGAIALEPTPENRKRVREVLKSLSRAGSRIAPERWADAKPFKTPGRWGAYAYKHPLTSTSKTGVRSLLRSTRGITDLAKTEWQKMREEQRQAREVIRRVEAAKS